jgi:hypothetical protein
MNTFFRSNPGLSSPIAQHLDFPDYAPTELEDIAQRMWVSMQYRLSPSALAARHEYIPLSREQPLFANTRSIRDALEGEDLRVSRVFE